MNEQVGQCIWASRNELEQIYHDTEWGVPLHDDNKLFEMLILEGMQAGLSWTIIMKRREAMREAFDGFNIATLAQYTPEKEATLLENPNIIRHRLKIAALRKNAQAFQRVQAEFGSFDAYIWQFTEGKSIVGHWQRQEDVPATIPLAEQISKDLKKRGFTFVGPTIVYSFMQAIGIVNDHIVTCPCYKRLLTMTDSVE